MSEDFLQKGMGLLNPPETLRTYLDQHTPAKFFERLRSAPPRTRVVQLLELYRDMALELPTPRAAAAREARVTQYDCLEALVDFEDAATQGMLDLVEEHALSPVFNADSRTGWASGPPSCSRSSTARRWPDQ